MLVNLTDMFLSEGKTVTKQIDLEMQQFEMLGEKLEIINKQPVELVISNLENGKVTAVADTKLMVMLSCDRCLKDVEYKFQIHFSGIVVSPEKISRNENRDEEVQDFMEGYHLNVETLVSNEILMNWPMKILCQDDCKGICKMCGRDLNTGGCDCDTFVPDPRMAGLKDIFSANKEV
ncbi:MAG: DUF177 domain-containing protein [Eubacteriales bacterium]